MACSSPCLLIEEIYKETFDDNLTAGGGYSGYLLKRTLPVEDFKA